MAHIGCAHNWDKSRRKNNGQLEQYDDLEDDRPSCYSGVTRRLFQSVLGHPLLKLVTEEVIKAAWDKSIEGEPLSEEDTKILQSINISVEQQQDFKNYLSHKYGSSFSSSLIFTIAKAFELTPTMNSHLFKHGGLMVEFFSKLEITEKQKEGLSYNPNRFFVNSVSELSKPESPSSVMASKR